MEHIFMAGSNTQAPTLLLLHGTGGSERDLIPIAETIAPHASVLGVRGNVLENGKPRFFKRHAEGIFDEQDLIFRTKELNEFITKAAKQYGFNRRHVVAIGYSNGANIAASLLYHDAQSLHGAILFHAMPPLREVTLPDLSRIPVFIGAGRRDPLIPPQDTQELSQALQRAKADVTEHWGEGGHELTREEIEKAQAWFEENYKF